MPSTRTILLLILLALLGGWGLSGCVVERSLGPAGVTRPAPAGLARIQLIAPPDGWQLREAFMWRSPVEAHLYYVELLDEDRWAFYRAEVREPGFDISPTFFHLLVVDQQYWWRVYGVDETGRRIATSDVRSFFWRG